MRHFSTGFQFAILSALHLVLYTQAFHTSLHKALPDRIICHQKSHDVPP